MTDFTETKTFIDFSMQQAVKKNQKWTFTEVPKTVVLNISCQLRRFGGFIVSFEHISHICSSVSVVNFEQVNAGWVIFSAKKLVLEHLWVAAFQNC